MTQGTDRITAAEYRERSNYGRNTHSQDDDEGI